MNSESLKEKEEAEIIVKVRGETLTALPQDLYIPPDALTILLETFEGPLDLLLYLIKKQNFDILDIPIAEISRQYVHYIDLMQDIQLELAAEYLVMAAMLAEIKSRLLLPAPASALEHEEDPRAELVRRLQEYERFKKAALDLDELPRVERDIFIASATPPLMKLERSYPQVHLTDLAKLLSEVLARANLFTNHQVMVETLSVRERMSHVLNSLNAHQFSEISDLYIPKEGKMGVVVTVLALLELLRQASIELTQSHPFAPIYIRKGGIA